MSFLGKCAERLEESGIAAGCFGVIAQNLSKRLRKRLFNGPKQSFLSQFVVRIERRFGSKLVHDGGVGGNAEKCKLT
jgi:hypothetical protein